MFIALFAAKFDWDVVTSDNPEAKSGLNGTIGDIETFHQSTIGRPPSHLLIRYRRR